MDHHEAFVRRVQAQGIARAAEARMDPIQRQIAVKQREEREMMDRMNEMRDRSRLSAQRRETRRHEALQSPKWDAKLVAEHNLLWLRHHSTLLSSSSSSSLSLREVVGTLLHRMVLDGDFASSICETLDAWKAWADNGGMRNSDFESLQSSGGGGGVGGGYETFALASLLVALIKDATTAHEGTLSMDLQECLRMWRVVRLG
ncbi:hypothetical protein F5Y07DRAFT_313476 [Xylaria sp. FL0933]|nr:hypothetical protein F5Y07DRAFT_313476 [Xylaria sp. FL0933]